MTLLFQRQPNGKWLFVSTFNTWDRAKAYAEEYNYREDETLICSQEDVPLKGGSW